MVFNEFQEIANWDHGEVERQMRAHFQTHNDVAYVFMGSKRHLMMDIFRNKNRPFYRFGKRFPLEKIPDEDFAEFILDKFRKGSFIVSNETIDEILNKTESHPYYTNFMHYPLGQVPKCEGNKIERCG